MLGAEPDVLRRLAAACRPGARFFAALNLHAWRPPVPMVRDTPEPDP
jgi:16S rRNA (adenine(1408)-N(1))-methyltransferase